MEHKTSPLFDAAANSPEQVLEQLHSTQAGLSHTEARKRLEQFGKNILIEEKHTNGLIQYVSNFKNPLVLILLFASVTSFVLGDVLDGSIITVIVLLSTLLNFIQEYHAGKAAQKLKERVSTEATVLRDGKEEEIKVAYVVPGDIIQLHAGDLVPADSRVLSAKDFFVNESSLTGESFPVEKDSNPVARRSETLTNLSNIVFSGSSVTTGTATAVVVTTGKATEIGKIGRSLEQTAVSSDFLNGVRSFSLLIMRTTMFFVLFVFFFNTIFKHTSIFESFTFAVALAVGLTPELLPMIMSVTMARGSLKMAKKGAIVKRLAAIPNFGSMDVLCTDKTGTLTEAKIELVKYISPSGKHSEKVLLHAYLNSYYQTGIKNPMDEAVIAYKKEAIAGYKKHDEVPFDFLRRRMSVVVEHNRSLWMITKGAPEEIFKVVTTYDDTGVSKKLTPNTKEELVKRYQELSSEGYRVLAIAAKKVHERQTAFTAADEGNMQLLGFIAFLDPAKKDVKEVLTSLQNMGIEVKVVTGDNELVTKKICDDVGLPVKGILLGSHMERLSDDALQVVVKRTTIFARFSPEQKNRVIHALKRNGHSVGYMGDGINDAPSLYAADVGISVENGVDVAKESADIILTHHSLHELKEGILEGRKTFGNTMKYIMMGISSNFGNMFSVLGAVLFIPYLPMLSIQILLNNLLYDLSQITIPTDNVDEEYIRQPKRWDMRFIKHFMIVFGSISSLFDFLTFFLLYAVLHFPAAQFQTGWFLESLATQTIVIHIIRTRKLPFLESTGSKYLLLSTIAIVCIGWMLPFTPLGHIFGFVPLPFIILQLLVFIVAAYLIFVQVGKEYFYKKYTA